MSFSYSKSRSKPVAATIGSKKGVLGGSKDGCRFAKGEGPKS